MAVKVIGLLGGSFDPVHLAHVSLAKAALTELSLDQVHMIPAANPWQRGALKASAEHRLAMLQLATRNEPALHINAMEIDRGGKTYTIDTVRSLPSDSQYVWILGADQLENFHTWHEWRDIASLVQIAVAARPGAAIQAPAELQAHLRAQGRTLLHIPFTPMPISASDIRHRLAGGQSTAGMLDPAVAQYIKQHSLYQQVVS